MTKSQFRANTYNNLKIGDGYVNKKQVKILMRYNLCKYVLNTLMNEGVISIQVAEAARKKILNDYNPYTKCLEEGDLWQKES